MKRVVWVNRNNRLFVDKKAVAQGAVESVTVADDKCSIVVEGLVPVSSFLIGLECGEGYVVEILRIPCTIIEYDEDSVILRMDGVVTRKWLKNPVILDPNKTDAMRIYVEFESPQIQGEVI